MKLKTSKDEKVAIVDALLSTLKSEPPVRSSERVMPFVLILEHSNCGYAIECPKKLWGVQGQNKKQVIREAMHYFQQYAADGEYGHNDRTERPAHSGAQQPETL